MNPIYLIIRWMLMILLVICSLLGKAISPAIASILPVAADFSAIDAYVDGQRTALKIPGLALAIVQGDQVAYVQGYGQAGPDKRPVTPQTSFMIGSTTKAFTALAILQLEDAGKVALDAPVQTYLPWFRVADPQASAQITLRHLLNQTSGFAEAAGLYEMTAHDLSDGAIEASVRRVAKVNLARTPGAAYEYANINFTILGQVIQVVSGQSYESYVQEHIFDPLEMRHSFTSQEAALQKGMATGYLTWLGLRLPKTVPFNRGNLPNGYLICSAEDMAHYLVAQLNEGRYGSTSVLSSQNMLAMHQPAAATKAPGEYYGMAWHVREMDGTTTVYHSGDNPNYQTHIFMLPAEKLGVVVMINVNGLPVAARSLEIAEGVAALVRGKTVQPPEFDTQKLIQIVGSVSVPVALALIWIAWMVFRYFRRQKKGLPARRSFWWHTWVIALPLLIDLTLIVILLIGIPSLWGLPLDGMALFFADFFTLVVASAVLLGGWGLARTVLTLQQVKSPSRAAL